MNKILAVLAGGLLIGAFAAANAELPPPTAQEKAAAAAKAEKATAEKAKAAKELAQAQDQAVANYKKNKWLHIRRDDDAAGARGRAPQRPPVCVARRRPFQRQAA